MSASTQTIEVPAVVAPRKTRGPGKGKRRANAKKGATVTKLPAPTADKVVNIPTSRMTVKNQIAAGYAAQLETAGPDWSAEYQKNFLAALSAALPLICNGRPKAA